MTSSLALCGYKFNFIAGNFNKSVAGGKPPWGYTILFWPFFQLYGNLFKKLTCHFSRESIFSSRARIVSLAVVGSSSKEEIFFSDFLAS